LLRLRAVALQSPSADDTPSLQEFPPSLATRLRIAFEHTKLFEELLGDVKSFAIMKKHFKAYVSSVASAKLDAEGFPGAKELRIELMETKNAAEVAAVVEKFLASL